MSAAETNRQGCKRLYREEDWIDWLLCQPLRHDRSAMADHLADCPKCRETVDTWRPLLGESGTAGMAEGVAWAGTEPETRAKAESGMADGMPAAKAEDRMSAGMAAAKAESGMADGMPVAKAEDRMSAGMAAAKAESGMADGMPAAKAGSETEMYPSERIRRQLRAHVQVRGFWYRMKKGASRYGKRTAACAAAIALILCAAALYRIAYAPQSDRNHYVKAHEPGAVPFMNDPETASYRIDPSGDELGSGYVWFNDDSQEVLVLLEGLLPSDGHVLQAWAVGRSGHANLGLLRHDEASRAHLYFKGDELTKAENIALTVEPYGGSDLPTWPDAFLIRLVHR